MRNAIKHTKTVPYHPASNEAAENAVRTFKKKFKVLLRDNTRHDALYKYLFYYRSTPHCTTEKTPAELHLNRRLRTKLDVIKPDVRSRVEQKQSDQLRACNLRLPESSVIEDSELPKDVMAPDRNISVTSNVRDNSDKEGIIYDIID